MFNITNFPLVVYIYFKFKTTTLHDLLGIYEPDCANENKILIEQI